MSERLLAIKNLTVASVTAEGLELDHVSLAIARGETLIVLGEAGCGKEALMDVLGGVPRSVADGTLQFGAAPPQRADLVGEPALRTAYLLGPYARPLSPHTSVVSQLSRVIARRTHTPRESARAEFALALARLDGAPPIHVFEKSPAALVPAVLAWGLLAAALAQTPELLLADHPLSGLAPTQARALARALLEEQARAGFSILYSAMGTGAARWLGGRLVIMRHGRIVEEGPVARLTTMQAHSYTQTLLKPIVSPPQSETSLRSAARGQPVVQAYAVELGGRTREKLTFEMRRGGALALIGEDGSGRRALAKKLLGLERIQSGRVVFDAVDIGVLSHSMMSRLRQRVAVIAGADDVLDSRLTVRDTVSEPLRASLNLPQHLVAGYRDRALKRVGLSSLSGDFPVSRLSAFDKRRLQVARAIVAAPVFALIDEPLRGLDAFAQSVVLDLLRNFREEEGPAFLVITADVSVAQALAGEAMIFKDGRVIERGPLAEILRAPKEPYTQALIEASRAPI